MSIQQTLTIKLGIAGPFICGAIAPASWGLDASFDRNYEGKPYIDRSHIKGKLRESFVELDTPDHLIFDWLGKGGELENGRLFFSDFFLEDAALERTLTNTIANTKQTRIRMNDKGVVDPTAMLVMENAFPGGAGKIYSWQGIVTFVAKDTIEAEKIRNELLLGFKWINALGAEKGVGFGRLVSAEYSKIKDVTINLPGSYPLPQQPVSRFGLIVKTNDPLLLGDVKIKANYQESRDYIYGSAIKGALAQAINTALGVARPAATAIDSVNRAAVAAFPKLTQYFSRIRFTHAFPSIDETTRPTIIPFSAVRADNEHYDVANLTDPQPIKGKSPIFQTDWKAGDYPSDFGWASAMKFAKTRTAIDPVLRRADDGNMFTYQYVCPRDEGGEPIVWLGEIVLDAVDKADQPALQSELSVALPMLTRLGKRASLVEVEMQPVPPKYNQQEADLLDGQEVAIVSLQTDAIILDPDLMRAKPTELQSLYQAYWLDVSDGSLKLERFFASQKMLGGYLYRRKHDNKPYFPFVLTQAGSVFVLKANDSGKARDYLKKIRSQGLDLQEWVANRYGQPGETLWVRCPFVPENGFGEVRINLEWQNKHAVPKREVAGNE